MSLFNRIRREPRLYLIYALGKILRGNIFLDKIYLGLLYRYHFHKPLNWKEPLTYSEKLQWLKVYYKNTQYTKLVDKYEVKNYVAEVIGKEFVIPTLGTWEKFEDIDFELLPDKFVLKCTHDSGGLVICNNKEKFDIEEARKKINHCLKRNYYWNNREWPYKNVKPRIIAEQYIEEASDMGLIDYKFFSFDGEVKVLFIATNRNSSEETCFDFYDLEFNHLPFTNGHPNAKSMPVKPKNYEMMLELATILSKGFPHVRIDFYNLNGKIYFGEMTFYHWSGLVPYNPEEWDYKFGEWLKLPLPIINKEG